MASRNTLSLRKPPHRSYLKLVLFFPLESIASQRHFAAAEKMMKRLLTTGSLDEGEETYLDALSDLVAAYEDKHHAIEPAADGDMLRHFLEAKGISQSQLSRETGIAKSSLSEVLAGRKPFSRQMIRKLADYFHVDVGVLAANL